MVMCNSSFSDTGHCPRSLHMYCPGEKINKKMEYSQGNKTVHDIHKTNWIRKRTSFRASMVSCRGNVSRSCFHISSSC
jgi:hypothetical protein